MTMSETMEAGRELDAEVAAMMGWREVPDDKGHRYVYDDTGRSLGWWRDDQPRFGDAQPHYSTEIAAAFLVVERMRKQGWYVTLDEWPWGRRHEESWRAEFAFRNELGGYAKEQAFATSPAHAICRAARAALATTTGREGRGDA